MTKTIYPVIMCGGSGTRLWPLSTKKKAKQYHALVTEKTMLQETVRRMMDIPDFTVANPSFVCASNDESFIREQCQEIGAEILHIILEPIGRNTAPLAAIVSEIMTDIDRNGLILLVPADHHIESSEQFWACIGKGIEQANADKLVTLGILPTHPETGFGYIKCGLNIGQDIFNVAAYVEKPDLKTAQNYVDTKEYFWNAGIFLFSPTTMLACFKKYAPEIHASCKATLATTDTSTSNIFLNSEKFAACPSDSLDYAIMEKADNVAMVAPVDIGWNDLGSWSELASISETSNEQQTQCENIVTLDCENTFVRTDGPLVAGVGLEDLIIVVENNKILIIPRDRTQDVKKIVENLKANGRDDLC